MPNPEPAHEVVEITQADREAAAAYYGGSTEIKAGDYDNSNIVQAFARYRQKAIAEFVRCKG